VRSLSLPGWRDPSAHLCLLRPIRCFPPAGPYFIPDIAMRANITEDRLGVPFKLSVEVIDVETCQPLACFVDLWTADAAGHYSGFLDSMIKLPPGGGGPPGKGKHGPHGPGGPGGPPGRDGPPRPRPTTPGPG
jgi:hypothetical protein